MAIDAAARTESAGSDSALPLWDLSDLYSGPASPQIDVDFDQAHENAERFHTAYAGRLAALDGAELGTAIATYEAILERLHKVMSYAQLYFAEDMGDSARGRFLQTMQERYNAISTRTLFFILELNRLDDATVARQMEDGAAAHYASWVRDVRAFSSHQLSDEMEKLLHEKALTGATAWGRLFDRTLAALRFNVDGKSLTLADTMNFFDNPDTSVRRTAAKALGAGLADNIELFSLIANTLAKDKEIEDKWRGYPKPVSYRNLSNRVEDEVVDALVQAVKGSYSELAHRYYAMKARWFGQDVLDYWDRNAPLPGAVQQRYTWDEAQQLVLDAFGRFDPRMATIASQFFDRHWIDAAPRPGKDSGAFAHPVVPSAHPYILLNFYGRSRDVTTLAHELGHGIHQLLAAEQGPLMSETPLTLAECASVFGEMLVFRAVLDAQQDPRQRFHLLASKVENMLNTVVRQIAFHEFERRLHESRSSSELSTEDINAIWMDVQAESLGPAFRFDDDYKYYWSYIPHFIHSPFYVYAYAFGDCLVNSLYQVYSEGYPGFQDKYLHMLGAGGTLHHSDLLQPFGLDARDPEFWRRGLRVVIDFIDELEALQGA